MIRRTTAAVLAGLVLTGCSGAAPSLTEDVPSGTPAVASASQPDPSAITIPKIDAHSSLIALGLDERGELAVPPVEQPLQASWYAGLDPVFPGDEFQPGEDGPAVIAGHVDGVIDGRKGQPGIFARLHELAIGDEIVIERRDKAGVELAPPLTFVVTGAQRYSKASFDHEAVYGPTAGPELRLVTCGGAFDRAAGHYTDNLVVFAELAP